MSEYFSCVKCSKDRHKQHTRSLSVKPLGNGKYSVKCFHGASCEWNNPTEVDEEELEDLDVGFIEDRVCEGKPIPEELIPKNNKNNTYFRYFDSEGNIIVLIHRIDSDKGKQIYPTYYDGDKLQLGYPSGKYLYNMPLLLKYPDLPVLVVEGEKAAEAAQKSFIKRKEKVIVTTWPLGSTNVYKGDWCVLKNRDITLWPDNDEEGIKAMELIKRILESCR